MSDIEELRKLVNGPVGNLVITEEEFNEAADLVKAIVTVTDENRLQLYGLYKQATIGEVNTKRPWGIDFVGCAKWDAWKSYSGFTQNQAKLAYVTVVRTLCGNAPGDVDDANSGSGSGDVAKAIRDGGNGSSSSSGDGAFIKCTSTPTDAEGSNSNPWSSSEGLFAATIENDVHKVRELLGQGDRSAATKLVNAHTSSEDDSMTALHYAADRGHVGVASVLLEHGAAVDAVDGTGGTALMNAVVCGHEDMVRLLLDAGANPELQNSDGECARSMHDADGDADDAISRMLQANGASAAAGVA